MLCSELEPAGFLTCAGQEQEAESDENQPGSEEDLEISD